MGDDDMETVTVESPAIDYTDFQPPDDWLTGYDPTLQNINFDPGSVNVDPGVQQSFGGGGGGGGGGTISSILQALGGGRGLLSDASGIMGLLAANNLKNLAGQAMSGSNPFGPYRDQYAKQLNSLMADPASAAKDPGFTSARDASLKQVEKAMAAQGYKGSGNMAAALYDRSNQFQLDYTMQKENQLAQLAGAGITPNYGPGLQGAANAYGVQSSGLAALGAGLGYAFPQPGLNPGAGSSGTPMGMTTRGGFDSAGGEAAQAIGLANTGINVVNNASKLTGGGNVISRDSGSVGGYIGEAGLGLGIYKGIEQGGVAGYGQAATDAAMLGSKMGLLSEGVGQAAGYIAAPLAVYNFAENWKSGDTASDAMSGMSTGAAVGSIFGPIGTGVGAVIGGAVGAISSAFGPGKKDPETAQWDKYLPLAQKNPDLYKHVENPFLLMAGLFDERSSTLPFYQKYGRMGENKFSQDLTKQINQALQSGQISRSDSPDAIYEKVVAPWVNSMGQGWSQVGPEYKAASQGLLKQMTAQYVQGQQANWKTIGGGYNLQIQPFGSMGGSSPPNPMAPQPQTSPPQGSPQMRPMPISGQIPQAQSSTGQIMSSLAFGMQDQFRSLHHA